MKSCCSPQDNTAQLLSLDFGIKRRFVLISRLTEGRRLSWPGVQGIAISVSVCLSVCPFAYRKKSRSKIHKIFCRCWMCLLLTTSTIRYVLPILWMKLRFHIMEPMSQNQKQRYVSSSLPRDDEVAVYNAGLFTSRFIYPIPHGTSVLRQCGIR